MPTRTSPKLTIANARSHFPIFRHMTYVASCSKGALSNEVRRGVEGFLSTWERDGAPMEEKWIGLTERSRQLFAGLIGADFDEIAIFSSVSAAVGAVASCFYPTAFKEFGGRNEVVLDITNFPTIGHVWELREHEGVKVTRITVQEGREITPEVYEPLVGNQTLLVSLSTVAYTTGVKVDLHRMIDWAHSKGILVLVDDSQINGTRCLDVHDLDVDFLVTAGMKYLCTPPGTAFLYVKQSLIERLQPSVAGWFGHKQLFTHLEEKGDDLIMHADERIWDSQEFIYASTARRFEQGTPAVFDSAGCVPALKFLSDLGLPAIEKQVAHLTELMVAGLTERNIAIKTPLDPEKRGPVIALRVRDPVALAEKLLAEHIYTSPRGRDGLRFAFHFYNSDDDVAQALDALSRHLQQGH